MPVAVGGGIGFISGIVATLLSNWNARRISREDRVAARHQMANLEILVLANRMVSDTMSVNIAMRGNGLEMHAVKDDDIRRTQAIAHFASGATQTRFDELMARWREWTSASDGTALGDARAKVREASDALAEHVTGETE